MLLLRLLTFVLMYLFSRASFLFYGLYRIQVKLNVQAQRMVSTPFSSRAPACDYKLSSWPPAMRSLRFGRGSYLPSKPLCIVSCAFLNMVAKAL